jgi:hypothetical protein
MAWCSIKKHKNNFTFKYTCMEAFSAVSDFAFVQYWRMKSCVSERVTNRQLYTRKQSASYCQNWAQLYNGTWK